MKINLAQLTKTQTPLIVRWLVNCLHFIAMLRATSETHPSLFSRVNFPCVVFFIHLKAHWIAKNFPSFNPSLLLLCLSPSVLAVCVYVPKLPESPFCTRYVPFICLMRKSSRYGSRKTRFVRHKLTRWKDDSCYCYNWPSWHSSMIMIDVYTDGSRKQSDIRVLRISITTATVALFSTWSDIEYNPDVGSIFHFSINSLGTKDFYLFNTAYTTHSLSIAAR